MKLFLIFIIFFLYPILLFSQTPFTYKPSEKITFEHINEDDGLSDNHITCILQDSKGYMWFGTKNGLNKYDGYDFTIFKYGHNNPHGLKHNYIAVIYEDSNGILWIGAHGKEKAGFPKGHLYKYNYENDHFKQFQLEGKITSISENGSGKILISTRSGINVFESEKEKVYFYTINRSDKKEVFNRVKKIYSTVYGDKNKIWIGTERGLYKSDESLQNFIEYMPNRNDSHSISGRGILSICEDQIGNLWIGTEVGGLNKYNIKNNIFHHFKYDSNNKNSLSHNRVQTIFIDSAGLMWVGTSKGLNKFDSQKNQFISYYSDQSNPNSLSNNNVSFIYTDNSGVVWIGTIGGGINKINKQINQFTHYSFNHLESTSLISNIIRSVYQDSEGNIWIGTHKGLEKFDTQNEKFIHFNKKLQYPYRISSNIVWDIKEDNMSNILIGTLIGGLNKFNPKTRKFKHFKNKPGISNCLSHNNIRIIFKDSEGIFWIGTNGGLNRFDPKNENFIQYKNNPADSTSISSNKIESICETKNGMWIGTQRGGLNKFNPETQKFTSYKHDAANPQSLSNNNIWSIYEDRNGELWVSTRGGLNKFNNDKDNFTKFKFDRDSIANDISKVIFEDSFNKLWVGNNSGLFKYDRKNEKFIKYGGNHGIPEISIDAILEDNYGYLWIYGEKYLIKLNLQTESKNVFKLNSSLNIPPRFKNSYLKLKDGKIIISGLNGFIYFDPNSIQDNLNIPKIVLTDFQIFNKSAEIKRKNSIKNENNVLLDKHISETEIIKIPYDKDVFSIEFAALDFRDPAKNKYAYKLDGVDPDWIYTDAKRRFATYNQLNPGEYTFFVKGSNNDGIWNEEGTSVKIVITPLWWQTAIFKIFVIIIIIGIVGWIFYYRINALKKKYQIQEEFARKLIDSQEMERKRIASALHDSHGQNLLVISNEMQYFTKEHNEYEKELQPVTEIIQESIDEIRNISYALHPHQLDKLGLVKTIKSMIKKVSGSTDVKFKLTIDYIDDLFEKNIEINIYRIIQEAINNIIKHADATKSSIEIKKNLNSIDILIFDNGKGFNKEEKLKNATGLGLSGIYERVSLIKGKLKIETQDNKGTKIRISIPI